MTKPTTDIVTPETAQQVLERLQSHRQAMVELTTRLANQESPSQDAASQAAVMADLQAEFGRLNYRARRLRGKHSGGQILFVPAERTRGQQRQLILGHCDTVWPKGTLATMPLRSDAGRLYGPGTYDMKAGLVQGMFALRVLQEIGLQPPAIPIVFVNSDEETGSQDSRHQIVRLANIVARAFVLEPSLTPQGLLKTRRKGVSRYHVAIRGRAAHAGLNPDQGASAITAMSYVIQQIMALHDPEHGTTVNVGTIQGGTETNVVAADCHVTVDARVLTHRDASQLHQAMEQLQTPIAGTSIQVTGGVSRPPLEATPRNTSLWRSAQRWGDLLGIELEAGLAGGGSDGNWTSQHCATLDGLGAVGDGAHALHEHVVESEMPRRAALLACLLLTPIQLDES